MDQMIYSSKIGRHDDRSFDQMREVKIELGWTSNPEASVLISIGNTRVLCTATFENTIPNWLKYDDERSGGWVSAEYEMLPRSTNTRNRRESVAGKRSGRTMEISRLIARSLRAVIDLEQLGENTITIDCDVLQADGGTRTTSITGGFIALALAVDWAKVNHLLPEDAKILTDSVAAISVGMLSGITDKPQDVTPVLDLDYIEDCKAQTDMNIVMTGSGKFVEVQGTAEGQPFDDKDLANLLTLGKKGIAELTKIQNEVLNNVRTNF